MSEAISDFPRIADARAGYDGCGISCWFVIAVGDTPPQSGFMRRINGLHQLICPTSELFKFVSSPSAKNILLPFCRNL